MPTREQVDEKIREGNVYIKHGKIEEGIASYSAGLELFNWSHSSRDSKNRLASNSDHVYPLSLLLHKRAEAYDKISSWSLAQIDLKEVSLLRPAAKAYALSGDIYMKQGLHSKAVDEYKKAQKLNQLMCIGPVAENLKKCEELAKLSVKTTDRIEILDDVMSHILSFLPVCEILRMSLVSFHFNKLVKDNMIWMDYFKAKDPKLFEMLMERSTTKIVNWRKLYLENLYIGRVYNTGNTTIGKPMVYPDLEYRRIIGMRNDVVWNEKNQYFLINGFGGQPALYLDLPTHITCDRGDDYPLGDIRWISGRSRKGGRKNQQLVSVLWTSNIFVNYKVSQELNLVPVSSEKWSCDSKCDGFVTNFKEPLKTVSDTVLLTKKGEIYSTKNETIKTAEPIRKILIIGTSLILAGVSGKAYLWKTGFESPTHLKDLTDTAKSLHIYGSDLAVLTNEGTVWIVDLRTLQGTKLNTEQLGKIQIVEFGQSSYILVTEENQMVGFGPIEGCYGKTWHYYPDTNNRFKMIDVGSGHIMKMGITEDEQYFWLAANANPKTINDIPNEKLICKYCKREYQRDKNHRSACQDYIQMSNDNDRYHIPQL
jgi:tetratricopeptide (TPR) repeat protein